MPPFTAESFEGTPMFHPGGRFRDEVSAHGLIYWRSRVKRMSIKLAVATAAVAAMGVLASCKHSNAGRKPDDAGDKGAPPPATAPAHAVQGEQLRDTMHRLAGHTMYSPTSKLPPDPESDKPVDPRVYEEAAEMAAGLAVTAAQITSTAKGRAMSDTDRQVFNAEVDALRRYALDLERAAKAHKIEQMQRAFDGVNASCVACHSRFRDFAGELDFGKADAGGAAPVGTGEAPAAAADLR
jgi:cytochrome c556